MNIYNSGKVEWTMGDIERMQKRIAELEREKADLVAQVVELPDYEVLEWGEFYYKHEVEEALDKAGVKYK